MFLNALIWVGIIYILAAILPAIFLMKYINSYDRNGLEPKRLLLLLIRNGVYAALLALVIESIAEGLTTYNAVTLALMVAIAEEGSKYFFLKRSTFDNPNFDYRFDGIVYAVFVSLGFAAFENVMYVFNFGIQVAPLRALLAIPAHMGFGVFMGAFYGRSKYASVQGRKGMCKFYQCLSLLTAILFHTTYDALAMMDIKQASIAFCIFVVVMYIVVYNKVRKESIEDHRIC